MREWIVGERVQAGPSEGAVRFRKRAALILCFGGAAYLLVIAVGLLRSAGAEADLARAYASARLCGGYGLSPRRDCRLLVPARVTGRVTEGGIGTYLVTPKGRTPVVLPQPANRRLAAELRARQAVSIEYWRGRAIAVRDRAGTSSAPLWSPVATARNGAVGAGGVLFFALFLAALGVVVARLPVDLARGGGPGRYALPYVIRPPQRRLYVLFALPTLAWITPAAIDARLQPTMNLPRLLAQVGGALVFAALVAAIILFFVAWYLENRIELGRDAIVYRTLFSRGAVRYDEIVDWQIRYRRRTAKVQYIDIYTAGRRKPIRLQLDMHWLRSREIVQHVLRTHARRREPRARSGTS